MLVTLIRSQRVKRAAQVFLTNYHTGKGNKTNAILDHFQETQLKITPRFKIAIYLAS